MKLILCGSRTWTDRALMRETLRQVHGHEIVALHGAARGADQMAAEIATEMGWVTVPFPVTNSDWLTHGRAAGPMRNQRMLEEGAQLVIAFRRRGESPGTDDMVRQAMKVGVPVFMVLEAPR